MCKAVVGTKLLPLPFVVHTAFCITYSAAGTLITGLLRSLKFASQSKLCPLDMASTAKSSRIEKFWRTYQSVPLLEKNTTNIGLGEQEFIAESQEYVNHYSFSLFSGIPLFLGWEEVLGSQQLYCWQPSGHGAAAFGSMCGCKEHVWGFLGTNQTKASIKIMLYCRRVF